MSHRHVSQHPPGTWIIVADRARARVFSGTWPLGEELVERSALIDDAGLLREGEAPNEITVTEIPHGVYRHRGAPETDYAHRTAQRFARQIVSHLDQGRLTGDYGKLILVAPPAMLGILRETLPPAVANMVVGELPQDYTRQSPRQIAAHLAARLPNPLAPAGAPPA
jgi:protein required for attachment to host cells